MRYLVDERVSQEKKEKGKNKARATKKSNRKLLSSVRTSQKSLPPSFNDISVSYPDRVFCSIIFFETSQRNMIEQKNIIRSPKLERSVSDFLI